MSERRRFPIRGLAMAAVAGGFAYLAFGRQDWGRFAAILSTARPLPLLVGLACLTADYATRALRWWLMLRRVGAGVGLAASFPAFLGSFALNNVLPLRLGDAVRAFGFREKLETSAGHILSTMVLERVFDLLSILGFLFAGLWLLPAGVLPSAVTGGALALLGGSLGGIVVMLAFPEALGRLAGRVIELGPWRAWGPSDRIRRGIGRSLEAFALMRSPALLGQVAALSVVAWSLEGAVFSCVARSLSADGLGFGPWFAMSTATLGTLLPGTPGYVGTFDYFAIVGLRAFGAEPALAAAFAILGHLILWGVVTSAGGALLLAEWGRSGLGRLRGLYLEKHAGHHHA